MATSTNYGWAEPDNSSLVKNGAQDIRTLGNAIDTSVWNVGFGQAGKNKIINGDFSVNQRNFSTTSTNGLPMFDRYFENIVGNGTTTFSAQTFTAGTAPVSGYEGKNYLQVAVSGESSTSSYQLFSQKIESVRTLAGQSATISFWAKANTGTPNILTYVQQQFGTGGSPSAAVSTFGTITAISTSWVRYSFPISIPSISGKTIGTNNDDFINLTILVSAGSANGAPFSSVGIQNNTFQFWGIQLEYGAVATPFQTATPTYATELAACQRYYFRNTGGSVYSQYGLGVNYSTTGSVWAIEMPVTMRIEPTTLDYSTLAVNDPGVGNYPVTALTIDSTESGPKVMRVNSTVASGLVAQRTNFLTNNNNAAGFIGFSAEL